MSTDTPKQDTSTDRRPDDRRTKRAAWEAYEITVVRQASDDEPGLVNIRNVSKADTSVYTVTIDQQGRATSCSCPDWQRRAPAGGDKHMRFIEATDPVVVAVTGDIDTPDNCACADLPDEWPCWKCYVNGRRDLPDE